MKKSELKNLIFECYCNVLAEKANSALLKEEPEELTDFDDQPYEPGGNDLYRGIVLAARNGSGYEADYCGKHFYILPNAEASGNYRDIVVKWEGEDGGKEYGEGYEYIKRPVPVEWPEGTANYIVHKISRKLGILKEDRDKESNMVFGGSVNEGDESALPDSTDQILAKFPTLKHCLVRLHTDDYPEFVAGIDWISPKPTGFRINLKNGQNYILTWKGKDFEAEISGKKYYLGQLIDFQQALSKLAVLYQEGPMGQENAGGEGGAPEGGADFGGGAGGGAGDFPGGDMGGEEAPEGGEESGSDEGEEDKDFSQEKVDFESDDTF